MSVAVVTGAASGMGLLAAHRLAETGWQVAAVDLPGAALTSACAMDGLRPFPCDVSDHESVSATAGLIASDMGPVDRLVNAAGIAVSGRIDQVPSDRFAAAMSVNYLGTVSWVKAVLPAMQSRRAGQIILFASLAGWLPTPGMAAYTATKFAVVGFAETLKLELRGSGLTLRCVCPPAVQTPMLEGIVEQSKPIRLMDVMKPITADQVLDAVDRSLRHTRTGVFVFPGRGTATAWRLRRFAPWLFEAALHRLMPADQ